jgi:hypothetical protein
MIEEAEVVLKDNKYYNTNNLKKCEAICITGYGSL